MPGKNNQSPAAGNLNICSTPSVLMDRSRKDLILDASIHLLESSNYCNCSGFAEISPMTYMPVPEFFNAHRKCEDQMSTQLADRQNSCRRVEILSTDTQSVRSETSTLVPIFY